MNEELVIVNDELKIKVDQLMVVNLDLCNFFVLIDLVVVVLDSGLNVCSYINVVWVIFLLQLMDQGWFLVDVSIWLIEIEYLVDSQVVVVGGNV